MEQLIHQSLFQCTYKAYSNSCFSWLSNVLYISGNNNFLQILSVEILCSLYMSKIFEFGLFQKRSGKHSIVLTTSKRKKTQKQIVPTTSYKISVRRELFNLRKVDKIWNVKNIPLKISNKTRMTGITTYTQHCNGIPCLCNKLKRFKRNNDWKSKNKYF